MRWLTILIATLIIPLVSASLQINPNPSDLILKQNEQSSFEATFTNNFDFKIIDFEFSNTTGFSFPDIELEPNESKVITYSVNYPNAGSHSESTQVSFKYLVDLPEGQQTHYVNITENGYSPDRIIVREDDTVIWTNNDQITRTVTSALFDAELEPEGQFSWNFNDIGTIYYQDLILYYAGEVVVINASEEEKVNNPIHDTTWSFNLEVALDPTDLEIQIENINFTVGSTGTQEGIMQIKNLGNIKAQKITLSSDPDWLRFDENEFDLNSGENNWVTFHIEPKIFETDATNKTYTIALRITGTNIEQTTKMLYVYVPYSNVFDDIQTNEGFLEFYARFCEENPTLFICDPTQTGGGTNQTVIIRDPSIPVNLSSREVLESMKRIQRIEDSNDRTNNELIALAVKYKNDLPKILKLLNESKSIAEDNRKNQTSKERAFWWAIFFIIIIICILVLAYRINKHNSKKSFMDGGYNFNEFL